MRSFLAGFLCLALSSAAFAQARGEVQSIGFDGVYRPGCWTPMVIRLTSTTSSPFAGRIEVVQEDLDGDRVLFTRQITLTGNTPNSPPVEQRFSMYFMPQPSRNPKWMLDASQQVAQLNDIINVRLCTDAGKLLVKLPITQTLRPVEPLVGGTGILAGGTRGARLVLGVYDRNLPNLTEYGGMWGLNEDVAYVGTRDISYGLPDDVRGYDAIDAIVWSDANPMNLSTDQVVAIEEFVRRGGRLVICQDTATNQWQRNNAKFPLLMPVNVRAVEERPDQLDTLRYLAKVPPPPAAGRNDNPWYKLKGPFRYAAAEVKPGATVVQWQTSADGNLLFDDAGNARPYAVRQPFGAGAVTWVAQDLGDKQILGERESTAGWVHVFDKVFDWPNDPVNPRGKNETELKPYDSRMAAVHELGRAHINLMDLPSTSAALIGIAVLFFIVYWVAAGPGSYFVLLKRGQATLSWFTFAAIAIAAVGLTYGIVKLVLRGDPQVRHVSYVRSTFGEPARVRSQFGLYIPRDGDQKIELKDALPNRTSYLTAYNLHPAHNGDSSEFPARQQYLVPVKEMREADRDPSDPRLVTIPYRSTLKKFTAEWVGNLPGGIDGSVKLAASADDESRLTGTLRNNTGQALRRVYLVVSDPFAQVYGDSFLTYDLVLYVSFWDKGAALDLAALTSPRAKGGAPLIPNDATDAALEDATNAAKIVTYRGLLADDRQANVLGNWTTFWYRSWRTTGGMSDKEQTEGDPLRPRMFPLLSFFDRLRPSRNPPATVRGQNEANDRFDFVRRGVRHLDLSSAVSAGNMAVIAVGDSRDAPLPLPLDVEGDRVPGKGFVYYQSVIPVDRAASQKAPISRPSTQPAKGKAEG
jgi:hypothetical protein